MKIAILGTRGIPNNYGGFEQFAEYVSIGLVKNGHEVYVYTSHDHPYQEKEWKQVRLIHMNNPEGKIGTSGQFIYDLLCIRDSRKRNFDIILQLGYTSSSVWGWLLPKKSTVVTNMDGLEWKRSKYSKKVRRFLAYAELLAVKTSDYLVADSKGIQKYLSFKYNKDSEYIPYGTYIFKNKNEAILSAYNLMPYQYSMLIARMEPENNIEIILDGVTAGKKQQCFLVIGSYENAFGSYLKEKYKNDNRIKFLGSLYDIDALNNLRYFSRFYFHGHSVGGTNPSLLEAMGSQALICAHQNEFNQAILESEAFYFENVNDVTGLIDGTIEKQNYLSFVENNLSKIEKFYLWPTIVSQYENYFKSIYSAI